MTHHDRDYATGLEEERLILEATETIHRLMEELDINRVELARRIGASKGHVSQLLDGQRNMTLRTLARLMKAVGHRTRISAEPLMSRASAPQPIFTHQLHAYLAARSASTELSLCFGRLEGFSARTRVPELRVEPQDIDAEFEELLAGAA